MLVANNRVNVPDLPTNWISIDTRVVDSGSDCAYRAFYRVCNGTEGASLSVTAGGTPSTSAAISFKFAAGTYSGTPEIASVGVAGSTNPNPPLLTPSWGSADALFIAGMWNNAATAPTGFPSTADAAYAGTSVNATRMHTQHAEKTASSEDPGAYTITTTQVNIAFTAALRGPSSALVIDTQPSNAWNGETIRPAVVVRMTTDGSTTDTGFTGNVLATRQTGTGTLGGTTTVAAVAGVATFSNLAITGSGAHTLRFTGNALTVDSNSFNVATGTGVPGGAIIIEEAMSSKPIAQNATGVSVEVDASNLADGTAATGVTHATSGLTIQYWKGERGTVTSVTPVTQTSTGAHTPGGFVHKAGGRYRIDLPNAAFDTLGTVTVAVTGVSGVKFGRAQVIVTAYDPTADNTTAQAQATAAAVRDDAIAQLQDGATFGESSIVLKDSTGTDQTITVTRAARNAIASTT